ncbi:hypothetical protein K432DRAFT_466805 [Lepidopterella palustris CBS 459.81]|uniref:Uncharacterized protein n=1 Tax=Lepidopterella palustris CBS 459.81 TaxID=1314670 RepID=A0A8E2E0Q1_9PEZI|nr:hypothetical protein K432DRAFT_466805 [Lepidopterella palustris CBS 459.81]
MPLLPKLLIVLLWLLGPLVPRLIYALVYQAYHPSITFFDTSYDAPSDILWVTGFSILLRWLISRDFKIHCILEPLAALRISKDLINFIDSGEQDSLQREEFWYAAALQFGFWYYTARYVGVVNSTKRGQANTHAQTQNPTPQAFLESPFSILSDWPTLFSALFCTIAIPDNFVFPATRGEFVTLKSLMANFLVAGLLPIAHGMVRWLGKKECGKQTDSHPQMGEIVTGRIHEVSKYSVVG